MRREDGPVTRAQRAEAERDRLLKLASFLKEQNGLLADEARDLRDALSAVARLLALYDAPPVVGAPLGRESPERRAYRVAREALVSRGL